MSQLYLAFSGIDGAGKSTQIDLLKSHFQSKNEKAKLVWARGGYTPGFEFAKSLLRKSRPNSIPKPGKSNARKQAFGKPHIRKIWLIIAILDLWFLYAIKCRIQSLLGTHMIFDRYAEDTLLDFQLNFPQEKVVNWWLWKFMKATIPSPDKHLVLLIPVEESLRRSKLKDEPFPDSEEVLNYRIAEYKKMAKGKSFVLIDCMHPIQGVHQNILETLKEKSTNVV